MSGRREKRGRQAIESRRATPAADALGREEDHGHAVPAGVQGPNFGYWQTTGSTRSGAKRSKRP